MDDLTEVKLKVDGKASDGFLVRRLSLKEGICRIPTAELVLCTKGDAIRMDELETYVEKAAALEISRTDAATTRRTTRWFSGMVTSVEGCGVVAQSRDGEVFEYRMTIQPRLVNLCYSRSGRNFIQMTAMEAVRTILKGFDVQYQDGGLPESATLKQDFFQRHESDYAFLMRILASCGLAYTFRTPDQTGRVTAPMMHVGTGNALPAASDFLCDGRAVLPSAFSCAALRTDGDYRKMDSWRMRKSIGVDSIEVGFTNRAGADVRGAAGTGDVRRMRMDEALFSDSKQGEIDRLVEEHLRKMRVPTAGWTGTTQCLEALPGNFLKVNHFYGRNSTEVIEALVFSSTLDCTLPILPGESVFGEDDRMSMRIALRCLAGTSAPETVSSAAETDSVAATAEAPDAATNGSAGIFGAGGGGGESAALFVKQAVVTDLSGSVTDGTTNAAVKFVKDLGYVFYAKVSPKDAPDKKFVVNFTQPVGGFGQGLFRMPRVGDRILVLGVPTGKPAAGSSQGATYYLLGYLPGEEMPFTTAEELKRPDPLKADEPYKTALPEEMMALRFRTTGKKDEKIDLVNKMGIRRAKLPNNCSELAFYNTHDFSADEKFKDSEERKVLANLQSTGDIQLSANHNLEMNARNLTFKGTGWEGQWAKVKNKDGEDIWDLPEAKVSFDAINKFVVEAKDSITFKVGHNSITIGRGGISLSAPRFTSVSGPIDANIKLDALSGVTINGLNCTINGFMSASIGESLGAGASFTAGNASVTGVKITQRTTPLLKFVEEGTVNTALLGTQLFSYGLDADDHVKREKKAQYGIKQCKSLLNLAYTWVKFGTDAGRGNYDDASKKGALAIDITDAVLKTIQYVLDTIESEFEKKHAEWMSQPANEKQKGGRLNPVTNGDAFRMAILCFKGACWLETLIVKTRADMAWAMTNMKAWDWLDSSAIMLKYSNLSEKIGEKTITSEDLDEYRTAAAATATAAAGGHP